MHHGSWQAATITGQRESKPASGNAATSFDRPAARSSAPTQSFSHRRFVAAGGFLPTDFVTGWSDFWLPAHPS
jgi:hypothetical protein